MTNRHPGRERKKTARSSRGIHVAMFAVFLLSLLASGVLWFIPVEVVQQWALNRAGSGAFERFQAIGEAEFSLWLLRIASTILPILIWFVWSDWNWWFDYFTDVWRGLLVLTEPSSLPRDSNQLSLARRARTWGCRGMLLTWVVLFGAHAAQGVGQRIHEWPYFRFNSGQVVLPNISDSNRAVIRYLQEATPPNARILVASDQKLFFLSYYLRPRTLLHRMHPESEHVIPLKEQQRRLSAYRLDELTTADLEQMPHDYTLEYFEHPDLVDRSQIFDDKAWIAFIRRREHNPSLVPAYVVRLRAARENRQ